MPATGGALMNPTTMLVIGVMASFVIGTLIYLYRLAWDEYAHGFRDGLAAQLPEESMEDHDEPRDH